MPQLDQLGWNLLFDSEWYRERYPEVASLGIDLQEHYLTIGTTKGYDPHPLFDTSYYLDRYPDVGKTGLNPLDHFLKLGAVQKCHPHPLFDATWYLERYPDVAAAGVNPLLHYLDRAMIEGRNPNSHFDTRRYIERHPELAVSGINPLVHYVINRRRIQVHRQGALGDVLLTTPILRALRIKYPDDEIVVSTNFGEILCCNPHIDGILRSANSLPGFHETFVLDYETRPEEHVVDAYARIAQVSVADRTPEIYLSQGERSAANDLLREAGLRADERFCVMQLTSGWPVRDWSVSHFKAVAEALEQNGIRVIVLGLIADPVIDFGLDFRGKTSVRMAAAIIEKCMVMVTIDSSLMHIAYALRRPVVSLFGCTDPEKRVPDWGLHSALYSDIVCRGCHHRQRPVPIILAPNCPWETVRCMERISAEMVINKVWEELERIERPLASIVIPHYTNWPMLLLCLSSIFRCGARCSFEVVVVANGSPSESLRQLRAWRPNVRIVTLQPNQGFSKACNAGARAARGKYVLFLNDDTTVTPGWLDEMISFIESDPNIGITGPKLLYPETGAIQHCGTVFNERGQGEHIYRLLPGAFVGADRPRFYRALTGACLLIDADFFSALGGFDAAYHGTGGCEDTELCFKVLEEGRLVAYCPHSVVYHYEGATRGLRDDAHPEDTYNRKILRERWSKYLDPDISDYCLLAEIERAEKRTWHWLQEVPPDIVARYDSPERRTVGRYPFRIQVGSATVREAGYLPLSAMSTALSVHIAHDFPGRLPFCDRTVGEILADRTTHIPWRALLNVLREFHRVLVEGGKLVIRTPDLKQIAERYVESVADSPAPAREGADELQSDAMTPAMCANDILFGNQGSRAGVHRSCLDAESMRALCIAAGFSTVRAMQNDLRRLPNEIETIAFR